MCRQIYIVERYFCLFVLFSSLFFWCCIMPGCLFGWFLLRLPPSFCSPSAISLKKKPKKHRRRHLIFFSQSAAFISTFCHSFRTLYLRALSLHSSSAFFSKISFYKSQNGSHHRGVFVVLVVVVQIKCSQKKKPPQRENLYCDGREAVRSAEEIHESTTNGRTSFD